MMGSTIAWLDHDEEHRRRMREAIGMFRDQGAVDELGLGRIRDAFSNRLFPGTSVLWQRARYLLFVPWVYKRLEDGAGGRGSPDDRAKAVQRQLASALRRTEGAGRGIIGASGADVKQPPDVILWAALLDWGIRLDPGRLWQLRADAVARSLRRRHVEQEEEVGERAPARVWNPRAVQLLPENFPTDIDFRLAQPEAEFLTELMLAPDAVPGTSAAARADSMLAVLLRDGVPDNVDVPWEHPMPSASSGLRDVLHHAGCFSDLVDGARLLYAKLVAETRKDEDLEENVDDAFTAWALVADARRETVIRAWAADLTSFWEVVLKLNPNVGPAERAFVKDWAALALEDPAGVVSNPEARRLVLVREHQAKGARRARLALDGSIGRDAPGVLPNRLTFRWTQAKSIASDIRRPFRSS